MTNPTPQPPAPTQRQHTYACEYPEGCSCGASEFNALTSQLAAVTKERDGERARREAAEEDSKRLDWLEKNALDFEFRFMLHGSPRRNFASGCVIRAVIDAAMPKLQALPTGETGSGG